MKELWKDKIEVDNIIKLPNGDTGKVLDIEKDGVSVLNFNEKQRIRDAAWKKGKCSYCNEKRCMMDLFKEENGDRYKCKTCINREIRKEQGWVGNVKNTSATQSHGKQNQGVTNG